MPSTSAPAVTARSSSASHSLNVYTETERSSLAAQDSGVQPLRLLSTSPNAPQALPTFCHEKQAALLPPGGRSLFSPTERSAIPAPVLELVLLRPWARIMIILPFAEDTR